MGVYPVNMQQGELEILNKSHFTNLSEYDAEWVLLENGMLVESGSLDVDLIPQGRKVVAIPFETSLDTGKEYFVTLSFYTRSEKNGIPAGHEVAFEQFQVRPGDGKSEPPSNMEELTVSESDDGLEVSNGSFNLTFSKLTGNISQLTYGEISCVVGELQPDFWRVPTDNDYGNEMVQRLGIWKEAHQSAHLVSFNVTREANHLVIRAARSIEDVTGEFNTTYRVWGDGSIHVDNSFTLAPYLVYVELPRICMQTKISKGLQHVNWYGRGPHENYSDRRTSARIGVWSLSVDELFFPYIRPQENGYRTDTRWATFTNDSGKGIRIEGDSPLSFGAQYYAKNQYSNGESLELKHTYDMEKEAHIFLNIDHKQMGVGGDNSWGARVHEEYRVHPHEYYYGFTISPVK